MKHLLENGHFMYGQKNQASQYPNSWT